MALDPTLARKNWRTLEPFHGFVYFSADAEREYEAVGLRPGRTGYFASRSAPMGAVTAEVVIATFFNFHPGLVRHAMDGAWDAASPADVHAARLRGVETGLRPMLGDLASGPEVGEALALARTAAEACAPQGRPLFAGLASLDWPDEPLLQLWMAVTLVREFRGDGHIAALVTEGIGPVEALLLHGASGEVPAAVLQATRAWPDDEWSAAGDAMADAGLLDAGRALTDEGAALRQRVESATDRLAMAPWEHLGQAGSDRLRELIRPMSKAILTSGGIGLPPA